MHASYGSLFKGVTRKSRVMQGRIEVATESLDR
jgi:hypothetical protein